jgi:hypothetical protein
LPSGTVGYVATGDFNHDGKLDIAAASSTKITILLNNGTGGFTRGTTFTAGTSLKGIAAASLRGNSLADLMVVDSGKPSLGLFYNSGNGKFGSAVVFPLGSEPTSIVTGDFNGDGAQDAAVTLSNSTAIPIFYNQGGTHITETASTTSPAFGQAVTFHTTLSTSIPGNSTPTGTVTFKQGSETAGIPLARCCEI